LVFCILYRKYFVVRNKGIKIEKEEEDLVVKVIVIVINDLFMWLIY